MRTNMLGLMGAALLGPSVLTVSGGDLGRASGSKSRTNKYTPRHGEKQRRKIRERAAKAALKASNSSAP